MNVWVFNQHAATPSMRGSTRHFDCATRLPQRGWDPVIFSGTSSRRDKGDTPRRSFRLETVDGVRFLWIRSIAYSANDMRRIWSMVLFSARAIWLGRRRHLNVENLLSPDVVIGSSVHPMAAAAACLTAKRHRVPFVLELRDLWPRSLIEIGALSAHHPIAFLLRRLEKWLVRRATRIIVLSERTADYLVERRTSRAVIDYVPNGVDLDRFGGVRPLPEPDGSFALMYLGAHGIANRLSIALEAAAILQERGRDNVRFVFVGGGRNQGNIVQQAEKMSLENVEFRRAVKKNDVPATLASADALLLTEASNVYGSSNKLSDYLAAGRPIIFSTFAEHNIIPGVGRAVPPHDAKALADTIEWMSNLSASQRTEMGECGRRYAETHRSWDLLADDIANVLNQAVNHRG